MLHMCVTGVITCVTCMKAATYYYGRKYRDCTRCVDMKSSDWSPDMIIRRREHPAAIFQAPLPPNLEKTRCVYAVQLKSWYDEQYNDWAKRYLREQLYNVDGIDRAAEYMYRNLPQLTTPRKKISPTKVTDDKEYLITQCEIFMDCFMSTSMTFTPLLTAVLEL